jgi:hypothetical protein
MLKTEEGLNKIRRMAEENRGYRINFYLLRVIFLSGLSGLNDNEDAR